MNFRIYYKYLSSRIASKWTVLLIDIMLVAISMFTACALQYGGFSIFGEPSLYIWMILLAILCNVCFFHIFRTYVGVIRYSSFIDIYRAFWSLTLGYGSLGLGNWLWHVFELGETLPNSILFIAYIFTLSLMICMRIAVKMLYEAITFDIRHSVNVFIYGFHGTGVNVAKSLRVNRNNHFRLRGFISDEADMIGKHTMGCRIYPNDDRLFEHLKKKNVHTVIISPSKVQDLENSGVLDKLFSQNIHVMTIPPLSDCMDDGLIKDIQIEDWLRREPIQIDMRKIAPHVEGRRIMITGAAGTVGREIVRQLATLNPYQLILVDQAESPLYDVQLELSDQWKNLGVRVLVADVANRTRMEAIFKETRPQIVFHVAAYKHAQLMDDYVSEAIQTNILGTVNVTDLAVKYKAYRMIMISADKVDSPANTVEYTKRIAEIYVQAYNRNLKKESKTGLLIVRFGDVYPENARCLTTLPEVCMLILEIGATGNEGEGCIVERIGVDVVDSLIFKQTKYEMPFVCDYEQIRHTISTLIEHSYTEKKTVLIDEMKKIIADLQTSSVKAKAVKEKVF